MKSILIYLYRIFYSLVNVFYKIIFMIKSAFLGIEYEEMPKISGLLFITGSGKIKLGKNVKLSSGRRSNPLGGETKLSLIASKNAKLTIGNNCGISNSVILCTNSIIIEDNVLIGNGCKIYDTDFHPINPMDRINNAKPVSKPVLIKRNAFIGAHSIILKGVTIGENSVIGAGSVVTKNIPDNEIWAGNPAKLIGKIHE